MTVHTYKGGMLRIHHATITTFATTGGQVWNLVDQVLRDSARFAEQMAPKRSFELSQSIRTGRPVYSAARDDAAGRFRATADHADFVIFGTKDKAPITSTRSEAHSGKGPAYMRLRPGPGYPVFSYRRAVAGQRKNDFMQRALKAGLRRHGL